MGIRGVKKIRYPNQKKKMMIFTIIFAGLVIAFSFGMSDASATSGDKIYVNTHGSDTWNGLSPTHTTGVNGPKASIKNATGTVNNHGTVYIANGIYSENNIHINNEMNIIGSSQRYTIVNGKNTGRIFLISPDIKVTISNLKLTRGNAGNNDGGAIYNKGTLTVNHCTFKNNTAKNGGGIFSNSTGVLNIKDSEFISNTATSGEELEINGGSAVWAGNTCKITDSTFTDNNASNSDSAAIFNLGNMKVDGSVFTGNIGGAIVNLRFMGLVGNLHVTDSEFTSNIVKYDGGGIFNDANADVSSSLFNGNIAKEEGGGICSFGNLNVTSCTFKFNSAVRKGGAIFIEPYFINSIVNIHFNRIVKNKANIGSGIYYPVIVGYEIPIVNASKNWWGLNSSPVGQIHGTVQYAPWLILSVNADPTTIYYGGTSTIKADLLHDSNGVYNNPVNGHVPNGIPLQFNPDWGSTIPQGAFTMDGLAETTFHADGKTLKTPVKVYAILDSENNVYATVNIHKSPTTIDVKNSIGYNSLPVNLKATLKDIFGNLLAGQKLKFTINGHDYMEVTNNKGIATLKYTPTSTGTFQFTVNYHGNSNYIDSHVSGTLTVNPSSYLYLKIYSSKQDPMPGESFTITYKLGNKGPDTAKNIRIYILLPKNFEISDVSGDGTWSFDPVTGQLLWKLADVQVGDPYLYITGVATTPGEYIFSSFVSSETFNLNRQVLFPFTINVVSETPNHEQASTISTTIPMQNTGASLFGLVLAILMVLGGSVLSKR